MAALVFTGGAQAFTCPPTTLSERVAAADVVFVGHSVGYTSVPGAGVPQRLYRFNVDQQVKGDVGRTVLVRVPVNAANGGQVIPVQVAAGILASRVGGTLFATRCDITDPGALLADVDQPKGNAVRLLLGVLFLGGVFAYSFWLLRRRKRESAPPH